MIKMEGLKQLPVIALALAVAGVILGATVIMLAGFGDTLTKCYNSSYIIDPAGTQSFCVNATNQSAGYAVGNSGYENLNLSSNYYTVLQSIESEGDVAEQLPTVAIIMVMVIIISVIMGVFVYMRYFS